ncbi:hypothetical protein [Streptomyces sp. NPDC048637]|uniref:hypothetical protein n=1 Tax=Streptomyces sp. NPDC048637 TaxID=3155636 RepID=UPI003423C681
MDWKWTVTAVLPVVSLVLGAWLTQLNDRRRDDAQLQREQRAHALERARQRLDRREEFELTHLGDLHTQLTDLVGASINYVEHRSEDRSEQDGKFTEANGKVAALTSLVLDDERRQIVESLHRATTTMVLESHFRDSGSEWRRKAYAEVMALHKTATESIAERIRAIYVNATGPDLGQ